MPNYQYKCQNGHTLDQIETIGADSHPDCPAEGCEESMSRVFGKVSFAFKGGPPTPNFGDARALRRRFER